MFSIRHPISSFLFDFELELCDYIKFYFPFFIGQTSASSVLLYPNSVNQCILLARYVTGDGKFWFHFTIPKQEQQNQILFLQFLICELDLDWCF